MYRLKPNNDYSEKTLNIIYITTVFRKNAQYYNLDRHIYKKG
jgi:hypothetical protein